MNTRVLIICQDSSIVNADQMSAVQSIWDENDSELRIYARLPHTHQHTMVKVECDSFEQAEHLDALIMAEIHHAWMEGKIVISDILMRVRQSFAPADMQTWLQRAKEAILRNGSNDLQSWWDLGSMFALADGQGTLLLNDCMATIFKMCTDHLALHQPQANAAPLPPATAAGIVRVHLNTFENWRNILKDYEIEFDNEGDHILLIEAQLLWKVEKIFNDHAIRWALEPGETEREFPSSAEAGSVAASSPTAAFLYLSRYNDGDLSGEKVLDCIRELNRMGTPASIVETRDGEAIMIPVEDKGKVVVFLASQSITFSEQPISQLSDEEE